MKFRWMKLNVFSWLNRFIVVFFVIMFYCSNASATLMEAPNSFNETRHGFAWIVGFTFQDTSGMISKDGTYWKVKATISNDFEVGIGPDREFATGITITGQHKVKGEENSDEKEPSKQFQYENVISDPQYFVHNTRVQSLFELVTQFLPPTHLLPQKNISGTIINDGIVNHPLENNNAGPHNDDYSLKGLRASDGILIIFEGEHVVPEPSTLVLFGLGILGLLGYGWQRRKRAV